MLTSIVVKHEEEVQFQVNDKGILHMFIKGFKFYQKNTGCGGQKTYWNCVKYRSQPLVNRFRFFTKIIISVHISDRVKQEFELRQTVTKLNT